MTWRAETVAGLGWGILLAGCGGNSATLPATFEGTGGTAEVSSAGGSASAIVGSGGAASAVGGMSTGGAGGISGDIILPDDPLASLPAQCGVSVDPGIDCALDGILSGYFYDVDSGSCLPSSVSACGTLPFRSLDVCELYCVTGASSDGCPSASSGLQGTTCTVEGSACLYDSIGCLCLTGSTWGCTTLDPACATATAEPGSDASCDGDICVSQSAIVILMATLCECADGVWSCNSSYSGGL